jgi:uncharacterized protein DUF6869
MTESEIDTLADSWIRYWHAPRNSGERKNLPSPTEKEWDLVEEHPEEAWRFVLAVLNKDRSKQILEVLSAGPLEDLLVKHGGTIIDRVEEEARANPMFAKLLGGVWKNSMTDDVWSRVQSVWDRRGWDDVPEE